MILTSTPQRAAVCAAGAAMMAAMTVTVAPTGHADTWWGAIATGPNGHFAISNAQNSDSAAKMVASEGCGQGCNVLLTFNACGALLQGGGSFYAGAGSTKEQAEAAAQRERGGRIVTWACNPPNAGVGRRDWRS